MQKRFEVTPGRIYVQVSDLVEVHKTTMYQAEMIDPAQISWASTSNKPFAAGAREFAAEINEAAEIAEALDAAFSTKQQLADAEIEQTSKVKKFAVIPPTATAQAVIYIPLGWFVYAPGHIAG